MGKNHASLYNKGIMRLILVHNLQSLFQSCLINVASTCLATPAHNYAIQHLGNPLQCLFLSISRIRLLNQNQSTESTVGGRSWRLFFHLWHRNKFQNLDSICLVKWSVKICSKSVEVCLVIKAKLVKMRYNMKTPFPWCSCKCKGTEFKLALLFTKL